MFETIFKYKNELTSFIEHLGTSDRIPSELFKMDLK